MVPTAEPALKKGIRKSVLFSGVAVVATGIAVSSGIVLKSGGTGDAASASLASTTVGTGHDSTGAERTSSTSPSTATSPAAPCSASRSDRRTSVDAVKQSVLDQDSGGQVTETEDLTSQDPRTIARAMLPEFGFGSDQFSCLDSLYIERERLERARRQPVVVRLRHPAGAARLEDGLGRLGLGEQRGHPDPVGPRLHPGPLRQPVQRLGLQAGPRLVLIHRPVRTATCGRTAQGWVIDATSSAASSCSSVRSPSLDEPHLDHDLADRLLLGQRLLGDLGGVLVADVAVQRRDHRR